MLNVTSSAMLSRLNYVSNLLGQYCSVYASFSNRNNFYGMKDDMYLEGQIPPEVGLLTELEWFDVSNNGISNALTGSLPSTFGLVPNIRFLDVMRNDISGTLPSEIGNCRYLEFFRVGWNNLVGSVPPSFGNLESLIELELSKMENSGISGTIPPEIFMIETLQTFHAQDDSLSGTLPNEIRNLKSLALNGNQISGSIPTYFGKMPYINMFNNLINI